MTQEQPSADIQALFEQAEQYDQQGDVYHAVKLYKHLIKLAPDWYPPYARLGELYKWRQDWKAALYYNKKAISLNVLDQTSWWNVGIAATVLKKPRLAQRVWAKFGYKDHDFSAVGARIALGSQFEIVALRPIDPVRGLILSVPHPASERRYQDILLYDRELVGYQVLQRKKLPVYKALSVFKRSNFHTFSCQLHEIAQKDLLLLENLCRAAHLGFENWSNLARVHAVAAENALPEYYGADFIQSELPEGVQVAIAATQVRQVEEILSNWEIISLKQWSGLARHL